ncbi:hypothetical protein CCUS01_00741 [Colletotrichum cuscutae]|uniref:Uncharacterized protein n=1 Tax=Colletotrichum cuscutae TaxID=1209917 RepID=A0AAI9Y6U1_9PEZI|nr:hypothetical protein CCUS01_00741 [Colletotrichum cuscutae]
MEAMICNGTSGATAIDSRKDGEAFNGLILRNEVDNVGLPGTGRSQLQGSVCRDRLETQTVQFSD